MKKSVLRLQDLYIDHERAPVAGLDLWISAGDIVELLGVERSGIRTLGRVFAGMEPVAGGFAQVCGYICGPGETLRHRPEITWLSEKTTLVENLSVAENIALMTPRRRTHFLINQREMNSRINFILSEYEAGIRAERPVSALTDGQKRFVELLRAAENEVPLVVVDQVLHTLSQMDLYPIRRILARLADQGSAILLLGNGFPLLGGQSSRMVVMRSGRAVRTFYKGFYDRTAFLQWMLGDAGAGLSEPERRQEDLGIGTVPGSRPVLELEVGPDEFGARIPRVCLYPGEILGCYTRDSVLSAAFVDSLLGLPAERPVRIRYQDRPYEVHALSEMIRLGIGFVPENYIQSTVAANMSYEENLLLPIMKRTAVGGFIVNRHISKYLCRTWEKELDWKGKRPIRVEDLGTYDLIRLVFQRWLIYQPTVLICCDILNDVDVQMTRIQTDYMNRLAQQGCGILIFSQNLSALRRICDRIRFLVPEG